jgi:CheY-like chemotaxis protein
MKILVIDDDDDIRFIAGLSLERVGGMQVVQAASGADGVLAAREALPDVILLDMMMPLMDGSQTLLALRSDPATASIAVIFLTAKTSPSEIERMKQLGAAGVLLKPFDPRTLADDVRAILSAAPS